MSVDSELLARSGQTEEKSSGEKAGDLRAAQRNNLGQTPPADESPSLRQVVQEERRSQAKIAATKAKQALSKATAPARRATSKLLQEAWINIIPSFGLTIIWINIHVFLGMVFGNNFFCKLGGEWIDENIKKAQADKAKQAEKMAGIFEGSGLACLDLGCLIIFLFIIAFNYFIIQIISMNWEGIKMIIAHLWSFVKVFWPN